MTRAWWTPPPLEARSAWKLEAKQIEDGLGLQALVSLSDHDCVEAGKSLSNTELRSAVPVSVEWSVPFRHTFSYRDSQRSREQATQWVTGMKQFSSKSSEPLLPELLCWLGPRPEALIVLNHPMWDEKRILAGRHWLLVREFLRIHGTHLHVLELNGLRPWTENRDVATITRSPKLPVISGGDRHAREPNACLNLTKAATFSEFVNEVRRDGLSDRVFYLCEDGQQRSISELWSMKILGLYHYFVALIGLVEESWLQSVLRMVITNKEAPAV